MLGLNDYGSSDEEEAPVSQAPQQHRAPSTAECATPTSASSALPATSRAQQANTTAERRTRPRPSTTFHHRTNPRPPTRPHPTASRHPHAPHRLHLSFPAPLNLSRSLRAPLSAHHNPHANPQPNPPPYPTFSIPPSPPGTPPPSTTAKFTKFLELKAQGTHFNARIAATPSLRNPGLLPKLLDFAGISQEESYASTLGEEEGGVMAVWPEEGYADSLQRSQSDIEKAREEEARRVGREKVEFVSAAGGGAAAVGVAGAGAGVSGPGTSNTGSRVSTPGSAAGSGATGRSGGVGREKGRVSAVRNGRGRWDEERRAGKRSRTGSRSPRR
ncbi:hypothetical protein H2199_008865 [Coniosporium tulheliwenetii]|uniref:Uncharacterized protein n=1 Tax=Coniosporium tulheliwenetii TaxID=3383036 RepID=A0ACC2YGW7_9PEZI|nr:hypothetical protein H2199_008865 [Cladosporium sp. JES 115]